jgi:hypothetical protein
MGVRTLLDSFSRAAAVALRLFPLLSGRAGYSIEWGRAVPAPFLAASFQAASFSSLSCTDE